jgi:hypothetical protein
MRIQNDRKILLTLEDLFCKVPLEDLFVRFQFV